MPHHPDRTALCSRSTVLPCRPRMASCPFIWTPVYFTLSFLTLTSILFSGCFSLLPSPQIPHNRLFILQSSHTSHLQSPQLSNPQSQSPSHLQSLLQSFFQSQSYPHSISQSQSQFQSRTKSLSQSQSQSQSQSDSKSQSQSQSQSQSESKSQSQSQSQSDTSTSSQSQSISRSQTELESQSQVGLHTPHRWKRSIPAPQFRSAFLNIFFELEVPLLSTGSPNAPLLNFLLDWHIIKPMAIHGLKFNNPLPTREDAFARIEESINGFGLDGQACVLRLLCEINARPLLNGGLLGDVINLIFRGPLASTNTSSTARSYHYREAQHQGLRGDCSHLEEHCPMSFLNIPFMNRR